MLEYLTVNKDSESITVPSVNATILNAQNAEQLTATVGLTEQVPYQFRPSADHAGIGNRETDEIGGGSLVWNQIAPVIASNGWTAENGVTASYDGSTVTITSTTANNGILSTATPTILKDHVYFVGITAKSEDSVIIQFGPPAVRGRVDNFSASVFTPVASIKKAASASNARNGISASPAYTNLIVKDYMVFDLTAMFGSTIADYIYSLETATAGAGVAWFKKLFPKSYYPYQPVGMRHVSGVSAHRMVGFNQWDEEWALGRYYNNNGVLNTAFQYMASKNKISIFPNTKYYFRTGASNTKEVVFYDMNGNYIGQTSIGYSDTEFTTPENARYMNFNLASAYGTTYKNDICINLSWSGTHNGEYEPYEVHEYALDDSLTLRGIPKLDANNELYFDGDTYASDGTVTRRYGIVDLGTLNWTLFNGYFRALNSLTGGVVVANNAVMNMVCTKYTATTGASIALGTAADKSIGTENTAPTPTLRVSDSAYSDAATFKAAMSGVMLVYELATPTTETAEPYTNPQIVNDWGTEEYVTDSIVPVGHKTFYPKDIVRATEGIPYAPTADGAYTLKVTVSGGTPTYDWVAE